MSPFAAMTTGRILSTLLVLSTSSSRRGCAAAFAPLTTPFRSAMVRQIAASRHYFSTNPTADSAMNTELQYHSNVVQDALYRIRQVNFMPDTVRKSWIPFQLDGILLGKVMPSMAQVLVETKVNDSPVFQLKQEPESGDVLTLDFNCGSTREERSEAVAGVMDQLRDRDIIKGWRDELFPVAPSFYDEPLLLIERAAVPFLGALEYGVHMNGVVGQEEKMWIARRSDTKSKFPGMLDHIVAGGQPEGISLMDNCVKECLEEAGIPEQLTRSGISPAGAISYESYHPHSDTISRVVLFNFDLTLPESFEPKPVDGEVQEFFLWTTDQILNSLSPDCADPIKPNCYVVIIDWLIRKGHLSPDVPGYLDVLRELRSGECR